MPDATSGPTRTSAAVVLLAAFGSAVALIPSVGPDVSVAIATVNAVLFAASLRLVDRDRHRVLDSALAGLLALFVGATFVLAAGYAALQLLAKLFPVATPAGIRPRGLRIVSATLVVVGGTLGMIGGLTTFGNALRRETVWEHAKLSVKTFVVPLLAATVMLASTLAGHTGDSDAAPLVSPTAEAVDATVAAFLAPVPGRTHLFTFCTLLLVTGVAVERAAHALPVAELAADPTDERTADTVASVRRTAMATAAAAGAVLPVSLVELAVPPDDLAGVVPGPVYDLLAAVTASGLLRVAMALLGGLAVTGFVAARALQRLSRTDSSEVALELMPFVGGVGVVALVALTHGGLVGPTIDFVADRLPGLFATDFTTNAEAVVDFYGSMAVMMTLAALLVGLTALLSLALALVTSVGVLPDRVAGPALAAGGTFLAAAFATGAGVGPPLVLGGLVASFVVWDAGEYGVTLRRETGPNDRENGPEAAHLGATLSVGVGAALLAFVVYEFAPTPAVSDTPTLPFALVAVVLGLFLLVAALR